MNNDKEISISQAFSNRLKGKNPRLLVGGGCFHSGTKFTAGIFSQLGLDIKHQDWGKDGSISWGFGHPTKLNMQGEAVPKHFRAKHPLWTPKFLFDSEKHLPILVARNPNSMIESIYVDKDPFVWMQVTSSIEAEFPEVTVNQENLFERAAQYMYYWYQLLQRNFLFDNLTAEEKQTRILRVEHFGEDYQRFADAHPEFAPKNEYAKENPYIGQALLDKIRKSNSNSRQLLTSEKKKEFTWEMVSPEMREKVVHLCRQLGYEPPANLGSSD